VTHKCTVEDKTLVRAFESYSKRYEYRAVSTRIQLWWTDSISSKHM